MPLAVAGRYAKSSLEVFETEPQLAALRLEAARQGCHLAE
jgi:hypothetical protein